MKRFSSFAFFLLYVTIAHAQAPKGINYQGVARDNEGNPLASKIISVRIAILKNAAGGEVEYSETHKPQTNQFGLFTLIIGQGTKLSGDFAFISWAVGTKWLQVEIDPAGGNAYTLAGSQQLMTVPYAFYAEYAGNGSSGLTAGQGISISGGVVSNTGDADNNSSNELQNLSEVLTRSNNAGGLKITNLGAPVAGADAATKSYVDAQHALDLDQDPANELQDISQVLTKGNDAAGKKITGLGAPTVAGDAATKGYVDTQIGNDLDKDPTNELQTIGQALTKGNDAGGSKLTNLGGPTIASDAATKGYVDTQISNDLDKDPTNELQTLGQVLMRGNDAGGNKITNVDVPISNNDATNKIYVDNAIARNFAFKVNFSYTNSSGSLQIDQDIVFTAEEFDSFNVVGGNSFTALENGIYVFTMEGTYVKAGIINSGLISLVYNSTRYTIPMFIPFGSNTPRFNATFMFKLTTGQTIKILGEIVESGATFSGNFFGYKL